jgi:hypothetical protein
MSTRFGAHHKNHWMVFHAIINMLQIEIEKGKLLMQVQYGNSKQVVLKIIYIYIYIYIYIHCKM